MTETLPRIAVKNSIPVEVEAGKKYFLCSCGLSQKQPFCDGAHQEFKKSDGTNVMDPVAFEAVESKTIHFCGCKHSKNFPLCDGTHKTLS